MYNLKNSSNHNHLVHDVRKRMICIPKNGERNGVDLDEGTLKQLKLVKYITISKIDDETPNPNEGEGGSGADENGPATTHTAESLLADDGQPNHGTWVKNAKEVLGDAWPGGTLKKNVIIELLKAKAES